jgi:mannose-1-phosphate guanylyltransferase
LSHIRKKLESRATGDLNGLRLATGKNIIPPVLVDDTAKIGEDVSIGPNVVIGARVRIEDGVRIQNATVLSDTVIRTHSFIKSSIIGRKCSIGTRDCGLGN